MRTRTLIHLVLSCLLSSALIAPAAFAHDLNPAGRERGHHSKNHDRHANKHDDKRVKDHGRRGRGGGQRSFFGVPADSDCSRETRTCDFTFSRSVTADLYEKLSWLLTEKMDAVESFSERLCGRATDENGCAGSFVAGLWNGLDALEIAVAETSCGTLRLAWSKADGFSQTWATTNGESCSD